MKTCGGADVQTHVFLASALLGGEWPASRSGHLTLGSAPDAHWIEGWVGFRAGVDLMEGWKFLTIQGPELPSLGRPARIQSLYRLHAANLMYSVHIFYKQNNTEW
jgi:hypothetical protein